MNTAIHSAASRWWGVLVVVGVLLMAAPALPQSTSTPGEYAVYEVNPFAGYQWFQIYDYKNDTTRYKEFEAAPVVGARFSQDFWKYVGLEESLTLGFNDIRLRPYGYSTWGTINVRNWTLAINPVLYFTPRESRIRPFVTVGPAATWYTPDRSQVRMDPGLPYMLPKETLRTEYGPALIYGGGVKINASRRVGLRFDIRGLRTQERHLELPWSPNGVGNYFSPNRSPENALSATAGITIRWGHRSDYVPPPPPPPPPAPKPVANVAVGGISGARDVCPGETLTLTVTASGWLPEQTPAYQWMVNGQPVAGATSSTFSVPTADGPGKRTVTVRVSVPESSKTSDPVTFQIKDNSAPTVRFQPSPARIPFGTRLPLSATAAPSACGGNTTLRYTASEGRVTGDAFDSSTVAFDTSNRLREQTKVVRLTATATDQNGKTGTAGADVTVTLSPEARRLDDIVFTANSARVNNCAKRLLLEQLTPMLRNDPQATVILIGHRDERERGRANAKLDTTRVLNAAAVLSAGTGICPQLELSRIKYSAVGTDQSSATRPSFCGESTGVTERSGQTVKTTDDRAQFRRVEVWIVPGGAAMPSGVSGLQSLPAADVQKLGCPK
jgi:outer membrane protein OmpA-like peptidoglycan-associated protein